MATYTTRHVLHLSTGQPFTFEVPESTLRRLELNTIPPRTTGRLSQIRAQNRRSPVNEFMLFGCFEKVQRIWNEQGCICKLLREILLEFGVSEAFVGKLLEDDNFVSHVKRLFRHINCDGERARNTLVEIYNATKAYFSATAPTQHSTF